MKDLFQSPELLPSEVRAIVEKYNLLHEQIPDNEICMNMLAELKPLGYTFDYGLDYEPSNLRLIDGLEEYYKSIIEELKAKNLKASRNEDSDYLDEEGNERYGVNIENEAGDVLDYEYFYREGDAVQFINLLNN